MYRRSRTQNARFGMVPGVDPINQAAAHSGGSAADRLSTIPLKLSGRDSPFCAVAIDGQ